MMEKRPTNLFLYSNVNSVSSYLSRNMIACENVIPERMGTRTTSTITDDFLFVTHKKYSYAHRQKGLEGIAGIFPVTVSLSVDYEYDLPAILAWLNNGVIDYELGKLNDYDTENHIGAFILGEIPFSMVDAFLFNNEDEKDSFYRISPDLWYIEDDEENLDKNFYKLIDSSKFTDNIDFSFNTDSLKAFIKTKLNIESCLDILKKREKYRSLLLNAIYETDGWQYGEYEINVDVALQKLLGISNLEVNKQIIPFDFSKIKRTAKKKKDNWEELQLGLSSIKSAFNQRTANQAIYDWLLYTFISSNTNEKHDRDYFIKLRAGLLELTTNVQFDNTAEKAKNAINEIYLMLSGKSNILVEDMLLAIADEVSVLKAFFFVAKDAEDYYYFSKSLSAYGADLITIRRACILFSAINGLTVFPGEYKTNRELWQSVEYLAASALPCKHLINTTCSTAPILAIKAEIKDPFDELHVFVLSFFENNPEQLTIEIAKQLLISKEIDKYIVIKIPKDICLGSFITKEEKKKLKKEIDMWPQIVNVKAIIKDIISDPVVFKIAYSKHKKFWNNFLQQKRKLK